MAVDVIMPKFGMAQEDALVVRWLRSEGDAVEKGDALVEVETDKVVMEVESPATGILSSIRAREGEVVPVTQVIAAILAPGETPSSPESEKSTPKATPLAKRVAEQAGVELGQVAASKPDGKIRRGDVESFLAQAPPEFTASGSRRRATPAARFLARQRQVPLDTIKGSGPRGRIQAADVAVAAPSPAPAATPAAQPPPTTIAQPQAEAITIPIQGMRHTIASRLTQSYQTIPHVQFTVEAAAIGLLALQEELQPFARQAEQPLSITSLLVKLCAWALRLHPRLNSSWVEDSILQHPEVNIGVAVALEEGLIVPVIHQADRQGLGEINRLVREQADKARAGKLTREDVSGGTFTISNLGMYGIDQFNALINPPQCAILAVGRIRKKAVVLETSAGDQVVVQPVMQLTLSVDHRAIDGAVAALFLRDLVSVIEKPGRLLW